MTGVAFFVCSSGDLAFLASSAKERLAIEPHLKL